MTPRQLAALLQFQTARRKIELAEMAAASRVAQAKNSDYRAQIKAWTEDGP